jgi:hypothetical protein
MSKSISCQIYDSLKPIMYELRVNDNLFLVPKSRTLTDTHRISIILPDFMNVIICNSYMLSLSDFKTFVIFNLSKFYELYTGIKQKFRNMFRSTTIDEDDDSQKFLFLISNL